MFVIEHPYDDSEESGYPWHVIVFRGLLVTIKLSRARYERRLERLVGQQPFLPDAEEAGPCTGERGAT
jgi:hypothetical protein